MTSATHALSSPGLDRAIQYSVTAVTESKGRGVLDAPLSRGMTPVTWKRRTRNRTEPHTSRNDTCA